MNILGYELSIRRKTVPQNFTSIGQASWWNGWGSGFWGVIPESNTGAWQRNVVIDNRNVMLSYPPVYAAVTGIASDIAKCRIKLVEVEEGIWTEITEQDRHGNEAALRYLPVLLRPNHFQSRIQFIQSWIVSLLLWGNTYVLKERRDGIVTSLYILDPNRVTPLLTPDGDVYYRLGQDYLAGVNEESLTVDNTLPAREIIHDRMECLWHPLIGVSPLYAAGMAATLGNKIWSNSTNFFANQSRPGGLLTAPGEISDETAARLKTVVESAVSGANIGKLLVLGDGLHWESMSMQADHAQLVEQVKLTREDVGIAFHYPQSKLGGPAPQYADPQQVQLDYYTTCLQPRIEGIEILLDQGLELPEDLGTEFDLENLLRMDTNAMFDSNTKAKGFLTVDEQRKRINYAPTPGGSTVYAQEQEHALEALYKRDQGPDPFGKAAAKPPESQQPALPPAPPNTQDQSTRHILSARQHVDLCEKFEKLLPA